MGVIVALLSFLVGAGSLGITVWSSFYHRTKPYRHLQKDLHRLSKICEEVPEGRSMSNTEPLGYAITLLDMGEILMNWIRRRIRARLVWVLIVITGLALTISVDLRGEMSTFLSAFEPIDIALLLASILVGITPFVQRFLLKPDERSFLFNLKVLTESFSEGFVMPTMRDFNEACKRLFPYRRSQVKGDLKKLSEDLKREINRLLGEWKKRRKQGKST